MKKLSVFILFSIVLMAPTAFAQREDHLKLESDAEYVRGDGFFRRIFVTASLMSAGYAGDDAERYTEPNGFSAGFLFDLAGQESFVLESGLLYRKLGNRVTDGFLGADYSGQYLSIPFAAKYYFGGQEATSLYVKGGLMGSLLVAENNTLLSPGARSWETAFLAGLGYKVALARTTDLIVELDYTRALSSIFPGSSVYRSDLSAALGVGVDL